MGILSENLGDTDAILAAMDRCIEKSGAVRRCKNCIYWSETGYKVTSLSEQDDHKYCASDRMVYDTDHGANTPIDGIGYMDGEAYGAAMWTGAEFGCIHWEKGDKQWG